MLASTLSTLVTCAIAPVAKAISIVPGNESAAEAEADLYPSVGQLSDAMLAPFCTGSLVSDSWFLTAAHCDPIAGDVVSFGDDLSLPSENLLASVAVVESYVIRPENSFNLLDGSDIALLQLDIALDDIIEPMALLNEPGGNLLGLEATNVGWGSRADGTGIVTDISEVTNSAAVFNTIDAYGQAVYEDSSLLMGTSNILSMDFDEIGNRAASSTGDDIPIPLEGQVVVGDSGGPALVQTGSDVAIAGVLSGGTTSPGNFGDVSWWTGIEVHFDWINNTIASATPDECVTWLSLDSTSFRPCEKTVVSQDPDPLIDPAPVVVEPISVPETVLDPVLEPLPTPEPITDVEPGPVSVPEPVSLLAMLAVGSAGLVLKKQ